jgi:hypothetical protein
LYNKRTLYSKVIGTLFLTAFFRWDTCASVLCFMVRICTIVSRYVQLEDQLSTIIG